MVQRDSSPGGMTLYFHILRTRPSQSSQYAELTANDLPYGFRLDRFRPLVRKDYAVEPDTVETPQPASTADLGSPIYNSTDL